MSSRSVVLFVKHSFVFSLALVFSVLCLAHTTIGQTKVEAQRAQAQNDSTSDSTAGNRAAAADNDYSRKIKEYTTEPYFMTELVDHLPMSAKVPSPDKVLGYVVGTPNKLTYTKDLYRYYRELAKASPRVRIFSAPEKSEDGKEQLLVAVGDEALLAKLDRYKEITAKLADPRKVTEAEAQALIGEGKVFYWAS